MVIDSHNKDYYPLMAPVSSYSVPGEMKETGGTIKARVGKPFVIALKCRGAYKWFLDFDYHMVRQDSHKMEGGGYRGLHLHTLDGWEDRGGRSLQAALGKYRNRCQGFQGGDQQ